MNTTLFTKTLKMLVSFILVLGVFVSYSPSSEAATTKATTYRLSADTYLYDKTTSSRKRLLTIKTGTIVSSTYESASFRRISYNGKTGYVESKYLTAYDKKETIKGQRFLVSKKTPLHTAASTTAPVTVTLNEQDAYYTSQKVTNSIGEVWYRVKYDEKTGYVRSLNEKPISYTNLPKTTLKTTDSYILRQYAGTGYKRQLVIPTGTALQTAGRIGDWYNVTYAGKSGYIHKAAFVSSSKKDVTTILETAFKTKTTLALYDATDGTKRSLVTIPSGTIVKSTARSGLYHRVTYNGKTGYALTASLTEYTATVKLDPSRFLLSNAVAIKSSPLSSSTTIASLQTGNVYYTTSLVTNPIGEQWHKISKDGKVGYVKVNQGKAIKYQPARDLLLKTTTTTALHSYAGPSYGVVQMIPSNTVIKIQGQIGNWYQVSYNGKSGYTSDATFTNHVTTKSIPTTNFKLKTDVAMKAAPKATATTVTTFKTNDIYQTNQLVTNGSSKWHRVTKDGQTGYIPIDQGTPVSYTPENIAMKTISTTTLRTYAGNSYATTATITGGTNVQVIGKIQDWYKVSSSGKTGYVSAATLMELVTKKTLHPSQFVLSRSIDVKKNHYSTADTLTKLTASDIYYTTQLVTNGRSEQWHQMKINGKTGYVRINQGTPISYKAVSATKYKTSAATLLRSYAGPSYGAVTTIPSGTVITVTGQVGNWLKITYAGKSGYAAASTLNEFTETKTIPEVRFLLDASIAVKSDAKDSASTIATLNKGNVYTTKTLIVTPTNSQWHQVTVNGKKGYVKLGQPTSPIGYKPIKNSFVRATGKTLLRSYVGDAYQPVASVSLNTVLPVTGKIGNWYEVSYEGKKLYAYSGTLVMTSSKLNIYNSVATPFTFDSFISAQLKLNPPPQTDLYSSKLMYVSSSYVRLGGAPNAVNGTLATVIATTPLNIRSGATTASHVYGQFKPQAMIKVYQNVSGFYTTYPRIYTSTTRYSTIYWLNALEADVRNAADPLKVDRQSSAYYQFLDLSKSTGATAATLNKILATKGIFGKCSTGSCGQAFIDAGAKYSLNEAYLISHALLETGNGSSKLATGVIWNGRTVYNMYGIGAYDSDAINTGAEYAYKQGWFTPEAAIIGGAEFISTKYVHNQYDQNTLYKMRWSPMRPGVHQYAT
ncbi:SH3 domain-containing protein, partial [Exiguobacterium artemiae]